LSTTEPRVTALRGPALTFVDDPFLVGPEHSYRYESDALIVMRDGIIASFGPYGATRDEVPPGAAIVEYGADSLVVPGFVDAHVHYPQTQMIGAPGGQLLDWLNAYALPAEQQFADRTHAQAVARVFLRELLRAGTTTAAVFCTVFPESVDAFFEESERLNTRMIAGKVLMDRNAPAALLDPPGGGGDASRELIRRWHGRGRQLYAVTPRFAPTSSPEQLEAAGALWREHPGTYLQSHVCENRAEVEWVRQLFPGRGSYLDVYDHYGQLGPRAIYGHAVWFDERDFQRCHETGTAIAHCPSSNLFLGSGLFRVHEAKRRDRAVRVGLGTDLGAGTSFSQLATMSDAYKAAQTAGAPLTSIHALYLATAGGARALYLDGAIGSIAGGHEADLAVLDLRSTPLIDFRMNYCRDLEEALLVQIILGDDRAVRATYVAGTLVHDRDAEGERARPTTNGEIRLT
jgi:guanine deaminase